MLIVAEHVWLIVVLFVDFTIIYGNNNDDTHQQKRCDVNVSVGVPWNVTQTAFLYPVKRFRQLIYVII